MNRRVGMTIRDAPKTSLLKSIKNRPSSGSGIESAPIPPNSNSTPTDILALPESSDDEAPADPQLPVLPNYSRPTLKSGPGFTSETLREPKSTRSSRAFSAQQSSSPKRKLDEDDGGLSDDFMALNSLQQQKRVKTQKSYSRNVKTFKQRRSLQVQAQPELKPSAQFKAPRRTDDLIQRLTALDSAAPGPTFKDPRAKYGDRSSSQGSDSSTDSATFKRPRQMSSAEAASTSQPSTHPRKSATGDVERPATSGVVKEFISSRSKYNLDRLWGDSTSSIPTSSTTFRTSNLSDSSTLSSAPSSPYLDGLDLTEYAEIGEAAVNTRPCPLCKAPVDRWFLESFQSEGRMQVRKQAKFCRAHKMNTARETWVEKGYPDIDWAELPSRFPDFYPHLEDVMHGRVHSYYRDSVSDQARRGENRTIKEQWSGGSFHTLTPGYYGSRGARIMMEHIITHFSAKLRTLMVKDKLMASGGASGYVQAVLVPELASRLVMVDMGIDDAATARQTMLDSIEIGELLNEEMDDEVKQVEDSSYEMA